MELRKLRYFIAVAEHGNFRRASEAINIAQSALSRHIGELSEVIGGDLFHRTPTGIKLTYLGETLYTEAKYIVDLVNRMHEKTRLAVKGEIGRLTVAVNDLGSRSETTIQAICEYKKRYPGVELNLIWMTSKEQIDAILSEKIDIGILADCPPFIKGIRRLKLGEEGFFIALPAAHRLASRTELTIADIAKEDFVDVKIARHQFAHSRVFAYMHNIGLTPNIAINAASEQMQTSMIRHGLGLGLVMSSIQQAPPHGVTIRPLKGLDLTIPIELVWLKNNTSHIVKNITDLFSDYITETA